MSFKKVQMLILRKLKLFWDANLSLERNRGRFERGSSLIADQRFKGNLKALLQDCEAFGNTVSYPRLNPHQVDRECPFLPQIRLSLRQRCLDCIAALKEHRKYFAR